MVAIHTAIRRKRGIFFYFRTKQQQQQYNMFYIIVIMYKTRYRDVLLLYSLMYLTALCTVLNNLRSIYV